LIITADSAFFEILNFQNHKYNKETIIFNTISKKVKAFLNNAWVDYSNKASSNNSIDKSLQYNASYWRTQVQVM
jgi:hypothetical protein